MISKKLILKNMIKITIKRKVKYLNGGTMYRWTVLIAEDVSLNENLSARYGV